MRAILLTALAAGLSGPALAATLSVPLNHSVRLGLSGSAASVVIGNPAIADVTVVDSRTLFLSGKGVGSTDVAVVDGLGRTIYSAEVAVSSPRAGRVSVYRGGAKETARTDMACSPRCEVAAKGPDGAVAAPSPAPSMSAPAPVVAPATN